MIIFFNCLQANAVYVMGYEVRTALRTVFHDIVSIHIIKNKMFIKAMFTYPCILYCDSDLSYIAKCYWSWLSGHGFES